MSSESKSSRFLLGFVLTALVAASVMLSGCYAYRERPPALVADLDVDQSLDVAARELSQNKVGTVLGIWALRDQEITAAQARRVSELYFANIARIDSDAQKAREFSVWHLTWAISNMYRLNSDEAKFELTRAYLDASARVNTLELEIAQKLFYGDEMLMGDIHGGGRAYARSHLVAPGNDRYLQSKDEYKED